MATIIELKYFNTFWLKKIKSITEVVPGSTSVFQSVQGTKTINILPGLPSEEMNVGQQVTMTWTDAI